MKRETLKHPKLYAFMGALKVSRPTALGHLVLLWDFVGEQTPRGNVGRWDDSVIAHACDWSGEPTEFVAALIESGWLDRNGEHRLLVHDWSDHCERWVEKKVERLEKGFLSGRKAPIDAPEYKSRTPDVRTPDARCTDNVGTPDALSNPIQSKPIQSDPNQSSVVADAGDDGCVPDGLLRLIRWWNDLRSRELVHAGCDEDKPAEAVVAGWKRVEKSRHLRESLSDLERLEGAIQKASICREGWFRLEKLMGGKNRDQAYIIDKLLEGAYADSGNNTGRSQSRQGGGRNGTASSAVARGQRFLPSDRE